MGQWHKTGCVLCAQNCGLEVLVEDNSLTKKIHRDPMGTLLRRLVSCRVEAA